MGLRGRGSLLQIHSRKLTWKPNKGPIQTTVPLKEGYMGFHVNLGECNAQVLVMLASVSARKRQQHGPKCSTNTSPTHRNSRFVASGLHRSKAYPQPSTGTLAVHFLSEITDFVLSWGLAGVGCQWLLPISWF